MSTNRLDLALETVSRETSVRGVLRETCRELVELLEGTACAISRVVGDLLVGLEEYTLKNRPLEIGHEYLISDYPLTKEVIERGQARTVWLADPQPERSEADLLEQLGFQSLLMVCLPSTGKCWGLVEVYGQDPFNDDDASLAEKLAVQAGARLEQLAEQRFG